MEQSGDILEILFYNETMNNLIHNALLRTFEPGFHFGPHCHNNIELCLIQEGECDIIINGESITVHKNEFIILFSNVIHSFHMRSKKCCHFLQLHFSPVNFLNLNSKLYKNQRFLYYIATDSRQYLKMKVTERFLSCTKRITDEINHPQQNHIAIANLYIYELILLLSREIQQSFHDYLNVKHPVVLHATQYIQENLREKISLDKIASECHVGKRYLMKIFQENMHVTVNDYINLTRINYAMDEIGKDDCNLTELAYKLGFSSVQYFTTVFKKYTGVTPKKFHLLHSIEN